MNKINFLRIFLITALVISFGFFGKPDLSNASKINELKDLINEKSSSVSELEKEIEAVKKELIRVGNEKKTLNNEVYRLNLDRKKISTDINITDKKIQSTSHNIEMLNSDINNSLEKIEKNNIALAESIRLLNEYDSNSLVEILLSKDQLSDFWDDAENLQKFQIGVQEKTKELISLKNNLKESKKEAEIKSRELLSFKSQLSDQKRIVDYNKKEKDQLLSITKNKEANYQASLKRKQKLMEEVLEEIKRLESQLKIEIDPESIPEGELGILKWPLEDIYITQYFGKTSFSTKNPQVYNGKGHTGIDFRAPSGTKVMSALGGVVKETGNTDSIPPKCYSYGKWILVEHYNGLSTLYAHLSLIKVTPGQTINAGEIIGYSGNTGYSTGPHLHFGVYASKGVRVTKFENSINCKDKYIPLAPYNAYLNPLSYLPKY